MTYNSTYTGSVFAGLTVRPIVRPIAPKTPRTVADGLRIERDKRKGRTRAERSIRLHRAESRPIHGILTDTWLSGWMLAAGLIAGSMGLAALVCQTCGRL